MVMPLYDDDPLEGKTTPYVTYAIIAINVLLSPAFFMVTPEQDLWITQTFALTPAIELRDAPFTGPFPCDLTLITSMFLHSGWLHLGFNMLFLWIFGDNIEDAMGSVRYLIFYVLCGVAGGGMHVIVASNAEIPLVGASGAISGVLAAYIMLRPCAKIEVFALRPYPMSAVNFIGLWMALQLFYALSTSDDGVAYFAHIGGALAGAVLVVFFRRPGVELFDCVAPADAGSPPVEDADQKVIG